MKTFVQWLSALKYTNVEADSRKVTWT